MQVETKSETTVSIGGVSRTFEVYCFEDDDEEGIAFRSAPTGFAPLDDIRFGKDIGMAMIVYKKAIRDFTYDMLAADK